MPQTIGEALGLVARELSDKNYAQSLDFYRFWCGTGQTYLQIPSDQIFDAIWDNRTARSSINGDCGQLIHSTAHLTLRFASDVKSDHILTPYTSGLQTRLCARSLQKFSSDNLMTAQYGRSVDENKLYTDANLIAHWANRGYVEEAAIRNHVLQSLISHPKLYDHQVDVLIVLFKLAGATFEAYADPSVVDRCFELLKGHRYNPPWPSNYSNYSAFLNPRMALIREVVALRESGWEGLPPPPVFMPGKLKPTGAHQKDPAATPVATPLGLPNRDHELQIPQSPPPESITVPEAGIIPESPVTPVILSPSVSISTLSDSTTADASDDESPTCPTFTDNSDDESLVDPAAVVPHETFYLDDGNVEVLCGNTLFRVTISTLSFHSPALRRMFAQTSLTTAESPNGCPRILSSDTAKDFATLLKMIYLPGFPERNKVPDFSTFSSLLRITAKYEMPAIRSQLLEVVRDAYPETFEGLSPSKPLGEKVFSGQSPHPNEVLNLFVQQELTSALPMAYYMATRKGPNSLMDGNLPQTATLSPEVLRSTFRGLMALREVELNGTHRLIFGPKGPCSAPNCPSRAPAGPAALEAYQIVFDRVVGSPQLGTNVLEVPELYEDCGGDLQCVGPGICGNCVEGWESGHAELRKQAWATLPGVFGLKG